MITYCMDAEKHKVNEMEAFQAKCICYELRPGGN